MPLIPLVIWFALFLQFICLSGLDKVTLFLWLSGLNGLFLLFFWLCAMVECPLRVQWVIGSIPCAIVDPLSYFSTSQYSMTGETKAMVCAILSMR